MWLRRIGIGGRSYSRAGLAGSLLFICLGIYQPVQAQSDPPIYVDGSLTLSPGQSVTLRTDGAAAYKWLLNGTDNLWGSVQSIAVTTPGYYTVTVNGRVSQPVRVLKFTGNAERNFVAEEQIRVGNIKDERAIDNLDAKQLNRSITYLDGLGRPLQQVSLQASPNGQDVVQPYVYDPLGRQAKSYLPYVSGKDGSLKGNWKSDQLNFYNYSAYIGNAGGDYAYTETVFEASPLSRPVEQSAPGNDWKIVRDGNGNSTGAGKTVRQEVRSNIADDKVYLTSYVPAATLGQIGTYATSAAAAGTLVAQVNKDEDGKQRIAFLNTLGQLVCQRVFLTVSDYLDTRYSYDNNGKLVLVLPPEAVIQANTVAVDATFLAKWAFLNAYDSYGRQVGKKVPGVDWMFTVYDSWGRVAATQNGNQRQPATDNSKWRWTYVKYDELNRSILTGEFFSPSSPAIIASGLGLPNARFETRADTELGYTLTQSFPTQARPENVLSVSFYDDYDYYPIRQAQRPDLAYTSEIGNPGSYSTRLQGYLTAARTRILGSTQWLTSVSYYDQKGRLLQTRQDNHKRKVDVFTNGYDDFEGKKLKAYVNHTTVDNNGASVNHTALLEYGYDAKGRVTEIYETLDGGAGGTKTKVAAYTYNELGQLLDKKLGYDPETNNYLQSLDYRYNVRGWLNKINDRGLTGRYRDPNTGQIQGSQQWLDGNTPNSDEDADKDLFGVELVYNTDGILQQSFNGNISKTIWNSATPNQGRMRAYDFAYDGANRLTQAQFGALGYSNGGYNWNEEHDDKEHQGRYTIPGITYDGNGNIKSLARNGNQTITANQKTYGPIDQLTLERDGNQLRAVTDIVKQPLSNAPNDFEDGASAATEYQYDANGNMTADANKGITIAYNLLNLPATITFTNGSKIENTYSATGEKLRTVVTSTTGAGSKQVDYIAGFVYGQGTNLFVPTPEGRALYEPARNFSDKWVYEYHIRDHLGSLRIALRKRGSTLMQASMEPVNLAREEEQFDHVAQTRQRDENHAYTGQYAARLNAGQLNRADGPATTMAVMAGDTIAVQVFGRYDQRKAGLPLAAVAPLAVVGSTPLPAGAQDEYRRSHRRLLPNVAVGVAVAWTAVTNLFGTHEAKVPRASLTYELYNRDSVLVNSKVIYLDETARDSWQKLEGGVQAKEDGYVRVSLTNASDKDVWLDDMQVRITPEMTVQENHYDAFGQNLVDIETVGTPDAKNQYTGQEKLDDLGLNLADYNARLYDSQLGRFTNTDAYADSYYDQSPYNYGLNRPLLYTDPDGNNPLLVAAAVGALFGGYSGYQLGQQNGATGWKLAGYIAGGAAIGAVSGYAGGAVVQSGIPFANTAALGLTSFTNSFGMFLLSGGENDVYTNFGLGSYNFTTGKFGYFDKKGNSSSENFGYALSFLTVASDYTDYKAAKRLENRNPSLERVDHDRKNMYGKYTGPGPDTNPRKMLEEGIIPINDIDLGAYNHDIAYYDQGASGVSGAFLSKRVRAADFALARDARRALYSGPGVGVSLKTRAIYGAVGTGVRILFTSIGIFKTTLQYSYLMPLLPKL